MFDVECVNISKDNDYKVRSCLLLRLESLRVGIDQRNYQRYKLYIIFSTSMVFIIIYYCHHGYVYCNRIVTGRQQALSVCNLPHMRDRVNSHTGKPRNGGLMWPVFSPRK